MASTSAIADSRQSLLDFANSGASATKSAGGGSISEAQNRFLKLLTTQLKNQDPLNPLDNAEVTSQLAQISTVSGIEKLNATLQTLLDGMSVSQTTLTANLVGHVVLVPGSGLQLASGASAGGVELAGSADEVTVTIKDANGLAVKTLNLGAQAAGVHNFTWDGATDNGGSAVDGTYSVSVKATRGGEDVPVTALSFATVRSLVRSGADFMLDLGVPGLATMDDVKQIL
ncbi:MAG: flagellar hook assembly protein FlgD [Rhodocyclaceae bacterium]|nr:flagellar hook assembly protein FlgD [Rhodocyclaceae bacterium]